MNIFLVYVKIDIYIYNNKKIKSTKRESNSLFKY